MQLLAETARTCGTSTITMSSLIFVWYLVYQRCHSSHGRNSVSPTEVGLGQTPSPLQFENFSHIIPFFFLSASLTCGSHSSQLVLSLAPFPNFVFPSYICHCLNWTVKYHWPIMFAFVLHIKFVYIHIWICTLYIVCVQLEENTPGHSSSDWW